VKVLFDARLEPGRFRGVEQVMLGTIAGLTETVDPAADVQVEVLGWRGLTAWFEPVLGEALQLRVVDVPTSRRAARALRNTALGRRIIQRTEPIRSMYGGVPESDGVIEQFGADLVHFPHQRAERTVLPSIYQPHDLQHRHLPAMFTKAERARRERLYRAFCEQADAVVVHCEAVRRDVIDAYGVDPARVHVVHSASVLSLQPRLSVTDARSRLATLNTPRRYALFPAQSWLHKNHLALVEALAILERSGCPVTVLCPGATTPHVADIRRAAIRAGIEGRVRLLGYVDNADLAALYAAASCVIYPSRYEGFGLPLVEAFESGVPVVCSGIEALAEVGGSAARYVDPLDPESIADGIREVWTDDDLAAQLRAAGHQRARDFTWAQTARGYRAVYAGDRRNRAVGVR
jgi:glycosyltransferase involved in cell wall biosynthesis